MKEKNNVLKIDKSNYLSLSLASNLIILLPSMTNKIIKHYITQQIQMSPNLSQKNTTHIVLDGNNDIAEILPNFTELNIIGEQQELIQTNDN